MVDQILIESKDNKGKALASFILGLVGIAAWFIPLFGLTIRITGFVLWILGRKSSRKALAITGIILCSIFFIVTVINAGIGAYIGYKTFSN